MSVPVLKKIKTNMALFLVCATRDNKSSKGSEVQGELE